MGILIYGNTKIHASLITPRRYSFTRMTSELQKNKTLLVLALALQPDTFCSPLVSQNPPSRPSTVR